MNLVDHLRRRLAVEGPLSVQDVMSDALVHPVHGYYATRDPFGVTGDFTTAPEISQMFGELIGLWAAVVWRQLGAPSPVILAELGPGRGTLMADALRAARGAQDFLAAVEVHLVEASRSLRERQAEALGDRIVAWHDDLTSLPDGPSILIANEFFDALPIVQLVRTANGWQERRLAIDPETDGFTWTLGPGTAPASALLHPRIYASARLGELAEVSPAALSVARLMANRLTAFGGAAIAIDYGHIASDTGDTLQAVRGHRPVPVLENLGQADLTAHVDFAALGRVVSEAGASVHGPVTQAEFLSTLGIESRAKRLMRDAAVGERSDIAGGLARLIGPDEMGTLFKVVAWIEPGAPVPPGFEFEQTG